MKTLEAALAVVLILSSIAFLAPNNSSRQADISEKSYECLSNLDASGKLRYYATNGMEEELKDNIRSCIPYNYKYDIKACQTVSCGAEIPEGISVYTANYIISGYDTYNPFLIRIWLWSS